MFIYCTTPATMPVILGTRTKILELILIQRLTHAGRKHTDAIAITNSNNITITGKGSESTLWKSNKDVKQLISQMLKLIGFGAL